MTALGVTGHQSIPARALDHIVAGIRTAIAAQPGQVTGYSSLAVGADQLFAQEVLAAGGELVAIIPSQGYEETISPDQRTRYRDLLSRCTDHVTLDYPAPSEDAFMAAGEEVILRSDVLVAVWDGQPAAGRGGTADAVAHARSLGKPVVVIWPAGVARRDPDPVED